MKYLIAGLGNIGSEYENTRHNIGFKILDELANSSGIFFEQDRYAYKAEYKFKGRRANICSYQTHYIHEFKW
jgi:PTH1 family peptidyl-tRNA hydrolase